MKTILARSREWLTAAIGAVPAAIQNIAGLAGVGLVSYGFWLSYPPAGFIVGGALLLAGALLAGDK